MTTSPIEPLHPAHRRVLVDHDGLAVPVTRVDLTNGETFDRYCTSGPDPRPDGSLPPLREQWIARREGGPVTQLALARAGVVTEEMRYAAAREGCDPELVRSEIAGVVAIVALEASLLMQG